jgi:hypothetical protein
MDSDALKSACKQAGILVEDRNYLSEPTARVEWDGPNGPSMHWLGFSNPALITFVAERLIEQIRQAHPFSALVACSEWTGDGWLFECEISDNCIRSHEPQFRAIVREGDTLNAAITRACMAVLQ